MDDQAEGCLAFLMGVLVGVIVGPFLMLIAMLQINVGCIACRVLDLLLGKE